MHIHLAERRLNEFPFSPAHIPQSARLPFESVRDQEAAALAADSLELEGILASKGEAGDSRSTGK